jgi:cytidylate kinase
MTPNLRSISNRSPEALMRAGQHWEARHQAEANEASRAPTAFTIALSRQVGARGRSVAVLVGERLGWQVYDNELLERIAQEMHLRASLLKSVDERRQSWIAECFESFSSVPTVTEGSYVQHLLETLLSLGAHGECVIVGRGAAQVLPPAATLRVRLVAPMEQRAAFVRQHHGLSAAEAARFIETTDRERSRFARDHFHKDPTDPAGYDLILNSGRFTVDECADLIIEGLRRLQAQRAGQEA